MGGAALGRAISAGIALAILNAVIALVLMTGRQLYATARDGVWPGAVGRGLTRVHPRTGAPWVATLAAGSRVGGLLPRADEAFADAVGSSVTLVYIALTLACLLHGKRRAAAAPGWKLPLWPWPPLLAIVLRTGRLRRRQPQDGALSFEVSVGCAAAAAAYYQWVLKPRGGWQLAGPSVEAPPAPVQRPEAPLDARRASPYNPRLRARDPARARLRGWVAQMVRAVGFITHRSAVQAIPPPSYHRVPSANLPPSQATPLSDPGRAPLVPGGDLRGLGYVHPVAVLDPEAGGGRDGCRRWGRVQVAAAGDRVSRTARSRRRHFATPGSGRQAGVRRTAGGRRV